MLDLKIVGGLLIDGSGAPGRYSDVGVRDGRIIAIDEVDEPAREVIKAEGRAVTPGFVDVHTHLDAEAFWDPSLSPSPLHGVTTAVSGNCGFSIAPLSPESVDYLMPMLARVEGMPLKSLRSGVPWTWTTTSDYLSILDHGLAANLGFMVGHSAIRRVVMGEAANERSCTSEELENMRRLLRSGLAAGGLGFSSSTSDTHSDGDGRPVPSRYADSNELIELARVCGEFVGTSLELLPKGATSASFEFPADVADLMIGMSKAARRPLNWNVISPSTSSIESCRAKLAVGDAAQKRGAKVIGLTMPIDMKARFSFYSGVVLDMFEGWGEFFSYPLDERMRILSIPSERVRLRTLAEGTNTMRSHSNWAALILIETFGPQTAKFQGRAVGEIARETNREPFDALVDIVIIDGLRTTFSRPSPEPTDADWEARRSIWRDSRAVIGASDAGAHLDMIAAFRYSTGLLEEAVRRRGLIGLEEAVFRLAKVPAELYGLVDRGQVSVGAHADLLVIDPNTMGSGPIVTERDLPGGASWLYARAIGIDHVIVGGVEVAVDGEYTGARPGRILHRGRDTRNPSLELETMQFS